MVKKLMRKKWALNSKFGYRLIRNSIKYLRTWRFTTGKDLICYIENPNIKHCPTPLSKRKGKRHTKTGRI